MTPIPGSVTSGNAAANEGLRRVVLDEEQMDPLFCGTRTGSATQKAASAELGLSAASQHVRARNVMLDGRIGAGVNGGVGPSSGGTSSGCGDEKKRGTREAFGADVQEGDVKRTEKRRKVKSIGSGPGNKRSEAKKSKAAANSVRQNM